MFAAFQLGNAFALITALGAPLLILAYLHRERARRRVVSSVLVLRSLIQRTRMKKRFVPPPRFFIELLALLLLSGAAALPAWKEPRRRVAIVVDTTISMRASDGGASRLSRAVADAATWLSEQDENIQVTVFGSSPKLQRIGDVGMPRAAAVRAIEGLTASYSGDSLEVAVADLAQSGEYDALYVISDRAAEFVDDTKRNGSTMGSPSLQSFFPKEGERKLSETTTLVEAKQVGSRLANFSLQRLRFVEKARSQGLDESSEGTPEIVASVQLSAGAPAELLLTLFREGAEQSLLTVGVKALPDRTVDVRLPVTDHASDAVYRVMLSARSGAGAVDAIKEDNTAWIAPSRRAQSSALFVSGLEGAENGFGLTTIEGFSVESISPMAFAQLGHSELERFSLLIFHHTAPAAVFEKPMLLILPPDQNPLFPIAGKIDAPKISSWVEEHPLSSYLKVPLIKPGSALLFATPRWARAVVNVEQGPILVAGESHGLRFAGVGIELLPFGGGTTPTMSILTLNLLNWLTGGSELGKATLSGGAVRLEGKRAWKIRQPSGATVELQLKGDDPEFLPLETPGVYRLEGSVGGSGGPISRVVTANVFYPDEAATFTANPLVLPRAVVHEELIREDVTPIWPRLIAIVIALLSFEALWAAFRGDDRGRLREA